MVRLSSVLRPFAAALVLAGCAPPEYRAAIAMTEGPAPETPQIAPLSQLLPDTASDSAAPPADMETLSARNVDLAARADRLVTPPEAGTPIALRAEALRARAEDIRNRQ